jgi:xylan 1,4-beta-xylosidase
MTFKSLVLGFSIASLSISCLALRAEAPQDSQEIQLTADSKAPATPLKHFWSTTVGAGRANEGLRASWQEQLHSAVQYGGFRYVRFHGLFHDDMFVYREQNGVPVYNFQYIDDLFDRMLANGARPFVELSFSPSDMVTRKGSTGFWWKGNGTPPSDYAKWSELVRRFAAHCIQRYGAEEVRSWYFEVWNEPNLEGFWTGTQKQYFELYKTTAITLKQVDPQLRVGGPATSNFYLDDEVLKQGKAAGADIASLPWHPIWLDEFLKYCADNRLPVDFLSTHPYPADFEPDVKNAKGVFMHRSVNSTRDDLALVRKIVDASPYPHAEIHLTEWSSSSSSRDHTHDSLQAAAFVVKTNLDSIGLVDSLSYWTFTDVFEEQGAGDSIFHGGFGMINYQGIPKPVFHGYRFLNALGDELLAKAPGAVVTRDAKTGRLTALAYNYPPEVPYALPGTSSLEEADKMTNTGSARELTLRVTGLTPGASFEIETLDREHANATAAWEAMGKPDPPTREETSALRAAAWNTKKELVQAGADGTFTLKRSLNAWTLLLVHQL